jgi:hypothetical protein
MMLLQVPRKLLAIENPKDSSFTCVANSEMRWRVLVREDFDLETVEPPHLNLTDIGKVRWCVRVGVVKCAPEISQQCAVIEFDRPF